MKKVLLSLIIVSLIVCSVSAKPKKKSKKLEEPTDFSLFMEPAETPVPYKALKEKVNGNTCNTLEKDTGAKVSLVVDKDYSKEEPLDLLGADITVAEVYGKKCLRITANYNPEIRFAIMFDKPVSLKDINHMKFSICGIDGGSGSYNFSLMYADMASNGEKTLSCYSGDVSKAAWTDYNLDLAADEIWGNKFSNNKEIIGIQLWTGDKGPIYMTDISLTK